MSAWATGHGLAPTSMAGQLEYLVSDLHSSYPKLVSELNSATSPQQSRDDVRGRLSRRDQPQRAAQGAVTNLTRALIDQLEPEDLRSLAERLAPYLPAAPQLERGWEWLDSRAAAAHLGVSIPTLRRLVASGEVPFRQDVDGGRPHFLRSELDRWRARG
jgi:excisionase family DNA binding protein